jgi:hypothetical protein
MRNDKTETTHDVCLIATRQSTTATTCGHFLELFQVFSVLLDNAEFDSYLCLDADVSMHKEQESLWRPKIGNY